jgi:hypothetical protein
MNYIKSKAMMIYLSSWIVYVNVTSNQKVDDIYQVGELFM